MSKRAWIGIGAVIVIGLVVVVWLIGRSVDQVDDGHIVYIGAILALTGDGAEFGKDELVGAQMAVDDINEAATDVRLELRVEDSRTQPRDAVSAYQKLMGTSPKPSAMITVMSSVSSALAPLVEKDRIPLFCVAAATGLTEGNEYVFRTLPTADYQARTLCTLSKLNLEYKTVGILYVTDDFGTSMQSAFASTAQQEGVRVVASEGIQTDASDFRPSLSKLIGTKPDAIYVAAFGSGLGTAVRQLRELGYDGMLLTSLEIGYPKVLDVAGEAAEGAVFVDTRFDAASSDPASVSFVEEFRMRANREPSLDAVLAYDEIRMIHLAGTLRGFTSEGIRAGLYDVKNYESLNGSASMQPSGDVAYELVLKTIQDGKPVPMTDD